MNNPEGLNKPEDADKPSRGVRSGDHATKAYDYLRSGLIAGKYAPKTRLLYGPIGAEIGISATPVREAAGRLANEGLVDLVPNVGAVVRTLDRDSLIEVYEVRGIIEPDAVKLAAQRASDEQIEAIGEQLATMKKIRDEHPAGTPDLLSKPLCQVFDRADYTFHQLIYEATNNQLLIRTASASNVLTRVFGLRPHGYDSAKLIRTTEDHQRIFDALKTRNPDASYDAALAHIRNGLAGSLADYDNRVAAP